MLHPLVLIPAVLFSVAAGFFLLLFFLLCCFDHSHISFVTVFLSQLFSAFFPRTFHLPFCYVLTYTVLLLSVSLVGNHQIGSTVTSWKMKNQFLEWYFCILDQLWWLILVFVLEFATCTHTILIALWNIFEWQILYKGGTSSCKLSFHL